MKLFGSLTSATFSPIVTIEPRRRKFHCPIKLKIPLPAGYRNDQSANLHLLCSITGGQNRAVWEDVTGSTPLSVINDCLVFTTTVSARFWLVNLRQQQTSSRPMPDSTRYAAEIYKHLIAVPFMAKFVIFAKRRDINEANIRVFCMTDDKEERTLEVQEHYSQVARSRDVEVLEGQTLYLEFSGNLVPTHLSGSRFAPTNSSSLINEQLAFAFHAFQENRLAFAVRLKEVGQEPSGRFGFMEDSIRYLASLNAQQRAYLAERRRRAICTLGVTLPAMCVNHDNILGTPKRNSYYANARIGDLSLADIANELELEQQQDHSSRARTPDSLSGAYEQSLLSGQMGGQANWLELAPRLGIPHDEVEFITNYCAAARQQLAVSGSGISPALILLMHWYQLSSPDSRDQDLARALLAIGRDDIAKKLNFPIEPKRISRSTMELLQEIELIPVRSNENLTYAGSELSDYRYRAQPSRGTSLRRLDQNLSNVEAKNSGYTLRSSSRSSIDRTNQSSTGSQQRLVTSQRSRTDISMPSKQEEDKEEELDARISTREWTEDKDGTMSHMVEQTTLVESKPRSSSSSKKQRRRKNGSSIDALEAQERQPPLGVQFLSEEPHGEESSKLEADEGNQNGGTSFVLAPKIQTPAPACTELVSAPTKGAHADCSCFRERSQAAEAPDQASGTPAQIGTTSSVRDNSCRPFGNPDLDSSSTETPSARWPVSANYVGTGSIADTSDSISGDFSSIATTIVLANCGNTSGGTNSVAASPQPEDGSTLVGGNRRDSAGDSGGLSGGLMAATWTESTQFESEPVGVREEGVDADPDLDSNWRPSRGWGCELRETCAKFKDDQVAAGDREQSLSPKARRLRTETKTGEPLEDQREQSQLCGWTAKKGDEESTGNDLESRQASGSDSLADLLVEQRAHNSHSTRTGGNNASSDIELQLRARELTDTGLDSANSAHTEAPKANPEAGVVCGNGQLKASELSGAYFKADAEDQAFSHVENSCANDNNNNISTNNDNRPQISRESFDRCNEKSRELVACATDRQKKEVSAFGQESFETSPEKAHAQSSGIHNYPANLELDPTSEQQQVSLDSKAAHSSAHSLLLQTSHQKKLDQTKTSALNLTQYQPLTCSQVVTQEQQQSSVVVDLTCFLQLGEKLEKGNVIAEAGDQLFAIQRPKSDGNHQLVVDKHRKSSHPGSFEQNKRKEKSVYQSTPQLDSKQVSNDNSGSSSSNHSPPSSYATAPPGSLSNIDFTTVTSGSISIYETPKSNLTTTASSPSRGLGAELKLCAKLPIDNKDHLASSTSTLNDNDQSKSESDNEIDKGTEMVSISVEERPHSLSPIGTGQATSVAAAAAAAAAIATSVVSANSQDNYETDNVSQPQPANTRGSFDLSRPNSSSAQTDGMVLDEDHEAAAGAADVDEDQLRRILNCKRLSEGCNNIRLNSSFIARKNSLHMIEELPPLTEGEPMKHLSYPANQNVAEGSGNNSRIAGSKQQQQTTGQQAAQSPVSAALNLKRNSQDETTTSCSSSTSLDRSPSHSRRRSSTVSQCSSVLSEGTRNQLNFDLSPDLPPDSSLMEANAISPVDMDGADRPASPEPSSLSGDGFELLRASCQRDNLMRPESRLMPEDDDDNDILILMNRSPDSTLGDSNDNEALDERLMGRLTQSVSQQQMSLDGFSNSNSAAGERLDDDNEDEDASMQSEKRLQQMDEPHTQFASNQDEQQLEKLTSEVTQRVVVSNALPSDEIGSNGRQGAEKRPANDELQVGATSGDLSSQTIGTKAGQSKLAKGTSERRSLLPRLVAAQAGEVGGQQTARPERSSQTTSLQSIQVRHSTLTGPMMSRRSRTLTSSASPTLNSSPEPVQQQESQLLETSGSRMQWSTCSLASSSSSSSHSRGIGTSVKRDKNNNDARDEVRLLHLIELERKVAAKVRTDSSLRSQDQSASVGRRKAGTLASQGHRHSNRETLCYCHNT